MGGKRKKINLALVLCAAIVFITDFDNREF